jgi:hypothetical protein
MSGEDSGVTAPPCTHDENVGVNKLAEFLDDLNAKGMRILAVVPFISQHISDGYSGTLSRVCQYKVIWR